AERLGGLLALSTYLPLAQHAADEMTAAARGISVFMAHGTHDPVIPIAQGERAAEQLTALGCEMEWHEYAMPHSLCAEEVTHIEAWLARKMRG
ncbi:MAG: carboxylesterase, partial [Gallionellaceae bacterium]|nr:carboxylesterase [Gallionellaceae bacterium]